MKTLKFGGTSVSDATNISRVLDIVAAAAREDRVVVVCSAMSGVTDMLVRLADCCSAASDPAALSDAQSVSAVLSEANGFVDRLRQALPPFPRAPLN